MTPSTVLKAVHSDLFSPHVLRTPCRFDAKSLELRGLKPVAWPVHASFPLHVMEVSVHEGFLFHVMVGHGGSCS